MNCCLFLVPAYRKEVELVRKMIRQMVAVRPSRNYLKTMKNVKSTVRQKKRKKKKMTMMEMAKELKSHSSLLTFCCMSFLAN